MSIQCERLNALGKVAPSLAGPRRARNDEAMSKPIKLLATYLHLARAAELRRRPHVRDRLLLLAGTLAVDMSLPLVAAYCRQKILEHNPRHLIGRWGTLRWALDHEDGQHLLRQVLRRYPPEKAERMLVELGLDIAREEAAYFSDEEYAAALLGTTPAKLREAFGDSQAM